MYFSLAFVVLAIIALYFVSTYNSVISKKNQIENAEGAVNVALKKRHELIPNLTACAQYDQEQQQLRLDKLVQVVKAINIGDFNEERMMLEGEVGNLTATIIGETVDQPNDSIMHLQRVWTEMEEQISAARRFYNTSISQYNTCIESFPSNLIASQLKLQKKEKYDIPLSQKFVANHKLSK